MRFAIEGRHSADEHVDEDAKSPNIYFLSVPVAFADGAILQSNHFLDCTLFVFQLTFENLLKT